MSLPLQIVADGKTGLQSQIFEQVRSMILNGTLRSGELLPATRTLGEQLGVSRNTITFAYERLATEGYIELRKSIGAVVSIQIPEAGLFHSVHSEPRTPFGNDIPFPHRGEPIDDLRSQALVNPHTRRLDADFWVGRPDPNSFPLKTWAKLVAKRLKSAGSALTEYRDAAGLPELRTAIADHLRPARGITASGDQIFIVGGCQDGLNLMCRMMLRPGSDAVIETPCYQGAAYLFESYGAKLRPIRVDDKGLTTSNLPETKNAIAYVTPSHQYPLGVTLSLDRRLELIAWAERTNSYILEDDYDSDFRFSGAPLAALKGLDRVERVIYVGTFSKCMGAGLRLGYVVLPSRLVAKARHIKTLMNNGQPWLEQAALADFMTSGSYERHLRHIRRLYLNRRNALLAALQKNFGESEVLGEKAGMHLVWRLPKHLPAAPEIEAAALKAGVGVYTLGSGGAVHFGTSSESDRLLVLGFSSLTEREIAIGISKLATALGKNPKSRNLAKGGREN
jgi:GntR family transcriptional regulator / MocR family aminotransferase